MKGREGSRAGQDLQVQHVTICEAHILDASPAERLASSHPRHSSFSREQQQLHAVKMWPVPYQTSTAPAAFHWGYSLVASPCPCPQALGQWLCLCTRHSIHVSTGPEICMTLHHPSPHTCITIPIGEQQRSDRVTLQWDLSTPCTPWGSSCLPHGEISILVHCCL